jgi:hypothetical protein
MTKKATKENTRVSLWREQTKRTNAMRGNKGWGFGVQCRVTTKKEKTKITMDETTRHSKRQPVNNQREKKGAGRFLQRST